jgi:hypothetical protein
MVLLPKNTLAPFPLIAAGFHQIELCGPPCRNVASGKREPPPPALPLSDFRPGETYPCDQILAKGFPSGTQASIRCKRLTKARDTS